MARSTFTVRVQLHEADWAQYEKLHAKMEESGYARQVTAESGTTYFLPDGEFSIRSSRQEGEIADEVITIANGVKDNACAVVTKSAGRAIRGLRKA
ncbi:type V toxin-antitoxin system endoribonuclease antitoxin GhoS [Rouxiella badensis]|jgi:hypothetical protein|uniref:DUF2622 domain-containing protein n=1 Tax=Rouxiella badensis TaxID=1646377 RepID=A0A1X0WF75_9GAMM|nr:type V toxin-antitoxin system endoribonuclease antitoxin GhoS [Rouxiella badensis]MCC3701836.1 type V toxin-antitoxin system endoribonuclease antitoxin GhoS [Rouxiella badensis]MCC3731478.1 type V toxin-antitoxin system endoribonuclease antitoxin GhoS [Rouxiella badensis]MCC3748884.1 type V toxin-antitoxin system endoribonuclease antitoxin GhoS [Rouxiella badensis]MCC3756867.1 type V toxin-antitoxin system endoribonuclease antitoxin GhoS [Rouxiella badensis]ORJ25458.1 DUF2622 domain-contain